MLEQATTRSFIPARVGDVWLILEAERVQEVVGARPWVPVPHASRLLPGVLAWRGRAVAVFDLSVLVPGGEHLSLGQVRARTLIVETDGCLLAMPVDVVREVQEVDASRVQPAGEHAVSHSSVEVEIFGSVAPIVDLASLVAAALEARPSAGHEA